jgi:UrcA family protein
MRDLNRKLMIPCGFLLMSWISTGASAAVPASAGELPTYHVNYADLNLGNPAGARRLFARIQSAARQVCQPVVDHTAFRFAQARDKSCMDKAIAEAVADVHSRLLTDVYRGRSSAIKVARK